MTTVPSEPARDLRTVADAAAVMAVVSWGVGNVMIKVVDAGGLALGFHRLWMASLLTTAIFVARRRRLSVASVRIALPSGIAFGLNTICMFSALKLTTVANATVIAALQPVAVLFIAARRYDERIRSADKLLTAAAVAGVALVVFGSSGLPEWRLLGDLIAALSLVTWTWYFVASKAARRHLPALPHQVVVATTGAVVVLPFLIASGQEVALPDAGAWLAAVLLVLIPGGGHLLMSWAHGHTSLSLTSLLTLGTPVVSTVGAAAVLGERVTASQGAGMAVVGVALGCLVARSPAFRVPAAPVTPPAPPGQEVPSVSPADDEHHQRADIADRPPPAGRPASGRCRAGE